MNIIINLLNNNEQEKDYEKDHREHPESGSQNGEHTLKQICQKFQDKGRNTTDQENRHLLLLHLAASKLRELLYNRIHLNIPPSQHIDYILKICFVFNQIPKKCRSPKNEERHDQINSIETHRSIFVLPSSIYAETYKTKSQEKNDDACYRNRIDMLTCCRDRCPA